MANSQLCLGISRHIRLNFLFLQFLAASFMAGEVGVF